MIYDYRTFRIDRTNPRILAERCGPASDIATASGGVIFGLFPGMIGFLSDEGVLITAWPCADALDANASTAVAAISGTIESTSERLTPTSRPVDATRPREPGFYAHRWFWVQADDWAEFLRLSEEGIWPYLESDGCRIIGLWRSIEPGDSTRALLVTYYPTLGHWERTRLEGPSPPPGGDEKLYRLAQDAGRARYPLTKQSIVRITSLAPLD